MKVLFVGDASNMHNCLAVQLRRMGHTAVVASNGSRWMDTARDIDISRRPGVMGTAAYLAKLLRSLHKMQGYDVVQLGGPIFLELKPWRIRPVFDFLKRHNRRIVLSALNTDYLYYTACHDGHTYRYSDYMVGDKPSPFVNSSEYINQHQDNWKQPYMKAHFDYIGQRVDGAVACLWEYYVAYKPVFGDKVVYAGIPIDTASIAPRYIDATPRKVRFFIGIQRDRNVVKGTDRMLAALKRVHERFPGECELDVVESVPYAQYLDRMSHSHVILDQLYSYTPATNALLAMAQGLVAVSGAEPEYYDLIGERDNHPIINVVPSPEGDIEHKLEWIVKHRDQLPRLSRESRAFVEKHNAAPVVAQRYLSFWKSLLG